MLLLDELLLLLGDLGRGQRGSAASMALLSWPWQGYSPGQAAQHQQNKDKGSAEGPQGHREGRQGMAELPLSHFEGHGERNRFSSLAGYVRGVTPALSTRWAIAEEK